MWVFKGRGATATHEPSPQYPQGHVGHLTPAQDEALEQFRGLVEEQGLLKKGPSATQDDAALLYVSLEAPLVLSLSLSRSLSLSFPVLY